MPTDPYAGISTPVAKAAADPYAGISTPVSSPAQDSGFQPTKYGFGVKPIDLGNGKSSVQRSGDAGVYFGPDQGNTGKPGWFDAKGNRLGDTPDSGPGFMDRQINADQQRRAHPVQSLISGVGNLGIGVSPGGLVQNFREMAGNPTPYAVEKYLPAPNVAGVGKGLSDTVLAPTQLVAHAVGSNAVDPAVNTVDNYYKGNFNESKTGEAIGQALPFMATMGGSAAAQAPAQALTTAQKVKAALAGIAKASGTGAVVAPAMTPETNVQGEGDYWTRKLGEAKTGAVAGGVLGAVPPVAEAVSNTAQKIGNLGRAPSTSELLDELGSRLGGKSPGVALQDAANQKYNAAWDSFKQAVAPVDAEAGTVPVDYKPAINKLQEVLGVGQKRAPLAMPDERRKVLQGLLTDLEETAKPDGAIDNSFAGAIDVVKRLGAEQRRLAITHGDTEARQMLGDVRDSILQSMTESNPDLSAKAQEARKVFATQVAPLFDKTQGGNFLTQIRDTPTPADLLGSSNQGALTRMKPDKARLVAQGSSADPMLYSYLDAAIKQGAGKPGSFATSLEKAMPAIEQISDPQTLDAFKGILNVAKTAKWSGTLANLAAAGTVGHVSPGTGAAGGVLAAFNPAMSGPGLMWKLMQAPATRNLLSLAGKLPAGSPELEKIGADLAKSIPAVSAASKVASNISPLRPSIPLAASTGTPDQIAENK